uniref:PAN domain protein n=1 Tax=Steinernema glaseri TaxID=37863 RepID=A0A1I8AAI7_9BILA
MVLASSRSRIQLKVPYTLMAPYMKGVVESDADEDVPFDFTAFDAFSSGSSELSSLDLPQAAATFNQRPSTTTPEPIMDCDKSGLSATFLRIPQVYVMGSPSFVSKIDLVTCAKHCQADTEPLSGEKRPCRGFNFQNNNDSPTCEYFDKNSTDVFTNNDRLDGLDGKRRQSPTLTVTIIKTGMLNWNAGLRSYYFEKLCLPLPEECRDSAFAFEKRRNTRFTHQEPFHSSSVLDERGCLESCLRQGTCHSVNFNRVAKTCELFTISHRSSSDSEKLVDSEHTDYFENNCVHEKDRCPGKRLEFIVSKKTEIRGRDVAIGVRSIRNCMRECVESAHFFCRSFEFDSETNECFIVEEDGEQAVSSHNLDLYEPVCTMVDVPCSRPYVFEKFKNRNIITQSSISDHVGTELNECLELCLVNSKCRSFTFAHAIRKCRLLAVTRADVMTRVVMDVNVDYYELGCSREAVLLQSEAVVKEDRFVSSIMLGQKKVVHTTTATTTLVDLETCSPNELHVIEHGRTLRQQHRHVHHVNVKDLEQCEMLCEMASIRCKTIAFGPEKHDCYLSSSIFDGPSQLDVFTQPNSAFSVYRFVKRNCGDASTLPATPSLPRASSPTSFPFTSLPVTLFRPMLSSSVLPSQSSSPATSIFRPTSPPTSTESTIPPRVTARRIKTTRQPSPTAPSPTPLPQVALATMTFQDAENSIPHKEENSKTWTQIPSEDFNVAVECLPSGMNVTFRVTGSQKYSGAVYAAERFSSCRELVAGEDEFSLFLPKPSIDNSCNVVEQNNSLNSVIVLSNDLVLPLDITTKDDLFFEIECDNEPQELSKTHYGLVVGGPDPKSVKSSAKNGGQPSKVFLKILKDNSPVENVFLGEKLTAVVESTVDASKLRVVDCNASRIGGTDAAKNSVKLISEGCSLMPQVIGDIQQNGNRLEVTLAAFRIDGSDQLDIACNVMVCKGKCPKQLAIPSFLAYCFSAWTYFSFVGLFLVSLGAIAMFLCIGLRKTRWRESHYDYDVGVVQIGTNTDGGYPLPMPASIPRITC